jgi:hypothetical protein
MLGMLEIVAAMKRNLFENSSLVTFYNIHTKPITTALAALYLHYHFTFVTPVQKQLLIFQPTISGQHSQDPQHLLQGQDLQEAHPPQGYPVQDW